MIRLQTAKGANVPNSQESEISAFERNSLERLKQQFDNAEFRTGLSGSYNCHGLAFASRRTKITESLALTTILTDDAYDRIQGPKDALPGDLVIYYDDDGDPTHSGVVLENLAPLFNPKVLSKWGNGPEVIHQLHYVPAVYGTRHRFFRCRL